MAGGGNQDFDDDQVIRAIGKWGPWQRYHISVIASITLFSAAPSLIIKFFNGPADYWCTPPDSLQDTSNNYEVGLQLFKLESVLLLLHYRCGET